MASKTWNLFDYSTSTEFHAGHGLELTGREVGGPANLTVRFDQAQIGLSRGVERVTLSNGKLRLVLLPTRGMSIWKAWYLGEEEEHIGWHSPVRGPVHPAFVPLTEPSGLGWLDGFDELLVRCGLESNGAPEFDEQQRLKYPLHGRIGNKPAHKLDVTIDDTGITVTGWIVESRFHFLKAQLCSQVRLELGSTTIDVQDEITNLSASEAEVQMLYHVNFGQPLLDAGSQVIAPVKELVPRNAHAATDVDQWNSYAGETIGYEEQVYFASLLGDAQGETSALLKNAHGTRGARLRFNNRTLPCLSVWKNTTAGEDGYVTGIEPGTNFPNPRSFEGEQGRLIRLQGRETISLQLGLDYCPDETSVAAAERAVTALQSSAPQVHRSPQTGWCAD